MAAGYDLKEGKYDSSQRTAREFQNVLLRFFQKANKKESTYKYAMLQSIIDCEKKENLNKISFDSLFLRFSEIYWILVFKHHIPQKVPTLRAPETYAEKIVKHIAQKYNIVEFCTFQELPDIAKTEMLKLMNRKCSQYVFGALFEEMEQLLFSFSKKRQVIILNPLMMNFIKKHYNSVQLCNLRAWSKFYSNIIATGKDEYYYFRLLKQEFANDKNKNNDKTISISRKEKIALESMQINNTSLVQRIRFTLQQYPDIGLYLAQISDQVGASKDQVKNILDTSFWSRKSGSRYYYNDISDADIINDMLFQEELECNENYCEEENTEINQEYLDLLDDPELLIKKLISKKYDNLNQKEKIPHTMDGALSKSQKRWTREEVVILVVEYFRTKNLSAADIEFSYHRISDFLRKREEILSGFSVDSVFRNYAGVRMQSSRIRCLDPETEYTGMQGTKLQKEIVNQYLSNPNQIIQEANMIYQKYRDI